MVREEKRNGGSRGCGSEGHEGWQVLGRGREDRVTALTQKWGTDEGAVTPRQDVRRSRESCFILEQGAPSKHWRRSRCQETQCDLLRTLFMCNTGFCGNPYTGDSRGCGVSGGRTRRKKIAQQITK